MGTYYVGIIKTLLYPHGTYEPPSRACLAHTLSFYNIILIYSVLTLWVLTSFQDHNYM